jgi:hypothetical protein
MDWRVPARSGWRYCDVVLLRGQFEEEPLVRLSRKRLCLALRSKYLDGDREIAQRTVVHQGSSPLRHKNSWLRLRWWQWPKRRRLANEGMLLTRGRVLRAVLPLLPVDYAC